MERDLVLRRAPSAALALLVLALWASPASAAFGYYKTATLGTTALSLGGNLTNYPVTIALDGTVQSCDADLKVTGSGGYVQSSSGYDIRPYPTLSDLLTQTNVLDYELVYYASTTGCLEMHFRQPTLNSGSNDVVYLGFGDSALTSDGSTTNTWNSSFKGVWHLKDGTTLSLNDSIASGHNGTNTGSVAAQAAEVDGGARFSSGAQIADFGSSVADLVTNWSISGWWRRTGADADRFAMFSRWTDTTTSRQIFIYFNATGNNKINVDVPFKTAVLTSGASTYPAGSTWHFYTATRNGNTWNLYVDGALVTGPVTDTTTQDTGGNATIGNWVFNQSGAQVAVVGDIDEVRIADADLGADWHKVDYNAQKPSSTYITWGSRTPTTTTASRLPLTGVGK